MKVLFLTAEAAPFAKTGGLGDVCGSLPKALAQLGHDVRIAMPAYSQIEASYQSGKWGMKVLPGIILTPVAGGPLPAGVFQADLPGSSVPVYFIADRNLFGNRLNIYGYDDDPYRFSFFSRAALELVPMLGWKPDIIHAHDWHTGPAIMWLATAGTGNPFFGPMPTLFTIHNLAYQGRSSFGILNYLGLQSLSLREESYGEVNWMARGIFHATMINTVSPAYAREIMTASGGYDLDGLLRYRHYDVHGILNGLDTDVWNPETDKHLAQNYNPATLDQRILNKRALQARAGLPVNDDVPLFGMVSRLDKQKGIDILGHVIHLLMNNIAGEAQIIVLGSGAKHYEDMLSSLAHYHRSKMTAIFSYEPELAPLIYAGADVFLMPSLFEPCGLSQMIAMRYGCVPIVRETGGLADTVSDGITGFTFYDFTTDDFWHAMQRAIYIYRNDQRAWRQMQIEGMHKDFSWQHSAYGYQQLYDWAIARVRGY